MGSKCFRPTKQRNQPVYISSINKAMTDAQIIYRSKNSSRQKIIQQIIANQNQKGNLKRLFQHLSFHQSRVIDAIKECSRRVSFDKDFSAVVVGSMFCTLLVKMVSTKKLNLYQSTIQQPNINQLQSKRNLVLNSHGLRNLIYELQSYFFQLVIKILAFSKQKKIHNNMSQMLIQYTSSCGDKIVAKKELKNILDLYLNVVFEKNIHLINKKSFLPFFAYSLLLSKSKSELFTSQFIEKHFNFILKIFFQLQDSKASSASLVETEDFSLFEQSIQSIIKEFILFSLENKKIKEHILTQIMLQSGHQKFMPKKMVKIEQLIHENLNSYSSEHFMMDWLAYMLRYIGKKVDNENESIRQSLIESMHETSIQAAIASYGSLKTNVISTQSKAYAVETLYRWFSLNLLDSNRALKNFSNKIFQALLLNLHNLYHAHDTVNSGLQVSESAKKLLILILQRHPERLKQIMLLLNKQLRKQKNQFYLFESQNLTYSRSSMVSRQQLPIIQDQAAQVLWKNNIRFLSQRSNKMLELVKLTQQEIQQLYAPINRHSKSSVNLVYLIQVAAIGLRHVSDVNKDAHVQQILYNFLCSLLNSMRISQEDIQYEYLSKLSQKLKLLSQQIITKHDQILFSFFKYCFKNLSKQNGDQVWLEILVLVIVVSAVIQKHKDKNQKKLQKFQWFLDDLLAMIKKDNFTAQGIFELYEQNKSLFDMSLRIEVKLENFKLKTLEHLENKSQADVPTKSLSNLQNSVISSRFQFSESNPDPDFVNVYKIVAQE